MPTSSPLSIATNAVTRLLKEQHFYEKDQLDQRKQISDAKAAASTRGKGDADEAGNEEFLLKQRVCSSFLSVLGGVCLWIFT